MVVCYSELSTNSMYAPRDFSCRSVGWRVQTSVKDSMVDHTFHLHASCLGEETNEKALLYPEFVYTEHSLFHTSLLLYILEFSGMQVQWLLYVTNREILSQKSQRGVRITVFISDCPMKKKRFSARVKWTR